MAAEEKLEHSRVSVETERTGKTFEFTFVEANERNDRAVILIPGAELDSTGRETSVRRALEGTKSDMSVNFLTMGYVGEKYDPLIVTQHLREAITKLHEEHGIQKIALVGSSFGASTAVRLAQSLAEHPIEGIEVSGLLAITPVIDEESIAGAKPRLLRMVPENTQVRALSMMQAFSRNPTNSKTDRELRVNAHQITSLKPLEQKTLPLECRVLVSLAEQDSIVDRKAVVTGIQKVASTSMLQFDSLSSDIVKDHTFMWNPKDVKRYVPFLESVFDIEIEREAKLREGLDPTFKLIDMAGGKETKDISYSGFLDILGQRYTQGVDSNMDSFVSAIQELKIVDKETLKVLLTEFVREKRKVERESARDILNYMPSIQV